MSASTIVRGVVVGIGDDEGGNAIVTLRMPREDVERLAHAGAFLRVVRVELVPGDHVPLPEPIERGPR